LIPAKYTNSIPLLRLLLSVYFQRLYNIIMAHDCGIAHIGGVVLKEEVWERTQKTNHSQQHFDSFSNQLYQTTIRHRLCHPY